MYEQATIKPQTPQYLVLVNLIHSPPKGGVNPLLHEKCKSINSPPRGGIKNFEVGVYNL